MDRENKKISILDQSSHISHPLSTTRDSLSLSASSSRATDVSSPFVLFPRNSDETSLDDRFNWSALASRGLVPGESTKNKRDFGDAKSACIYECEKRTLLKLKENKLKRKKWQNRQKQNEKRKKKKEKSNENLCYWYDKAIKYE